MGPEATWVVNGPKDTTWHMWAERHYVTVRKTISTFGRVANMAGSTVTKAARVSYLDSGPHGQVIPYVLLWICIDDGAPLVRGLQGWRCNGYQEYGSTRELMHMATPTITLYRGRVLEFTVDLSNLKPSSSCLVRQDDLQSLSRPQGSLL